MMAWLPSILTLVLSVLSQLGAPDWINAHPNVAVSLATLGGIINHVLPSPVLGAVASAGLRSLVWIFLALAVFSGTPAHAQQAVSVDMDRATLSWTWTQASGSAVLEFHAKCGGVSGQYNKTTVIQDPLARTHPLRDLITGPGEWFCEVQAANNFGESGPSNEIHFFAGSKPDGSLDVQLIAS